MTLLVSRGFANAADQDDGEDHDDEKRRDVEPEVPARRIEHVALQIGEARGQIGGRDPAQVGMDPEPVHQATAWPANPTRDRHVGEGVFKDQVPADDPRDQLAKRGVGVGVG